MDLLCSSLLFLYNDDEYNDVNEHLLKHDSDESDQSNEVNDNKPDF